MCVFGGTNGSTYFSSVHLIDLSVASPMWFNPSAPNGVTPLARSNHLSAIIGDLMFVYGGRNSGGTIANPQLLDLTSTPMTWYNKSLLGASPGARMDMSWGVIGGTIYLYGGHNNAGTHYTNMYRTDTEVWTAISTSGGPVTSRNAGTIHGVAGANDIVFLWGGYEGSTGFARDTMYIYIRNSGWQPVMATSLPTARSGHTVSLIGSTAYFMGGWGNGGASTTLAYNDVWSGGPYTSSNQQLSHTQLSLGDSSTVNSTSFTANGFRFTALQIAGHVICVDIQALLNAPRGSQLLLNSVKLVYS
jgi:hypothetical protein